MALGAGNDLGQGFLTDYSGIAGAGAAFQGFASAYKDAQDQQMKRQELQSKIMAQQEMMKRDATEQAIKMKTAGLQQGSGGPTDLQPATLSPQEQSANALKAFGEGARATGTDQYGNVTGYAPEPNSPKMIAAKNVGIKMENAQTNAQNRISSKEKLQGENTFNKDPLLNQYIPRLDGATKIKNLIQAARSGDVKSNQALLGQLNNEIGRLETGSQSPGLGMAEKTEMNDTRAHLENVKDTLFGTVTNVDLGDKFNAADSMINDLGSSILQNVKDRGDFLKTGGTDAQNSIYDQKVNKLVQIYGSRFQSAPQQKTPPQSSNEGMLAPQGFLGKGGGFLGFGQKAQAAPPAPAQHPQDNQAVSWAQANLNSKDKVTQQKAKTILQQNGVQ